MIKNRTEFRTQQMLNNASCLIAWAQTVPPEPGKDLVNAGVTDMTLESAFARIPGNWLCFNFSHCVTVGQINTY
jgi:hypothetical protein